MYVSSFICPAVRVCCPTGQAFRRGCGKGQGVPRRPRQNGYDNGDLRHFLYEARRLHGRTGSSYLLAVVQAVGGDFHGIHAHQKRGGAALHGTVQYGTVRYGLLGLTL